MKHIIIFTIFAFFSHLSLAQEATLNLEWTQTEHLNYVGSYAPQVLVDDVGNTFVCANTGGGAVGFITIKYDSLGNFLWKRNHNTINLDILKDGALLSDGSIVVAGVQESINSNAKVQIFCYNTNGDTLWTRRYQEGTDLNTSMEDMLVDEEDNIYIIGHNYHDLTEERNLVLTKINSAGQTVWDNWYWYNEHINAYQVGLRGQLLEDKIVVFADGFGSVVIHQVDYDGQTVALSTKPFQDIILFNVWLDKEGYTYIGNGSGEYKVTKLDLNGDTLWTYVKPPVFDFPNLSEGSLTSVTFDVDNNIYIAGHYYTEETRADCLITKLDDNGNVLWEKIFRLTDEFLNDAPTALFVDENYVYLAAVCNTTLDIPENNDYVLVVYTLEGEEVTHITYDNEVRDIPKSITVSGNNIYITGNSHDGFPDPIHALTQKYRLDISSALPDLTETTAQFSLYPNPTQDKIQVDIEAINRTTSTPTTVQIYNAAGHLVKIGSLSASVDTMDLKDLAEGLYVVHVLAGQESLGVEKLVIVR